MNFFNSAIIPLALLYKYKNYDKMCIIAEFKKEIVIWKKYVSEKRGYLSVK